MNLAIGEWQVRSWRLSDEESLVKYANNRRIWINLRDSFPHPYTPDDAKAWLRSATTQAPELKFAISSGDEAIGGIGLRLQEDVFRGSAEIGYWVGEPFWGKGIATRAVQAFTEFAFTNLNLVRVFGEVFEWNPASAKVLGKAGYVYEGRLHKSVIKDGQIIDRLLYARTHEG